MNAKTKPLPSLRSDAQAEAFVASADLTEYDLSGFRPMRFEIAKKEAALNMRLPAALLDAVRAKAKAAGRADMGRVSELIKGALAPKA